MRDGKTQSYRYGLISNMTYIMLPKK